MDFITLKNITKTFDGVVISGNLDFNITNF